LEGKRTFVGFGFGAIQGGLFLYEAFCSGNFRRLVVAEVLDDVVRAVRRAGGRFAVNIAHADRVEVAEVGPVAIEDPAVEADRARLIEAVAAADELATAVPSVQAYVSPGPGSIHRILAEGLRRKAVAHGPRAVVYAAENHSHAAEILEEAVLGEVPPAERAAVRSRVRFLNTVIAKMSGVVTEPETIAARNLAPICPQIPRAFLVEAFNRILISKICFEDSPTDPPYRRGITVFEEKPDLLPFEEAKFYSLNAIHALAAYVGMVRGVRRIAELRDIPDVLAFLRAAFIQESGETMIRRYGGIHPLFTPEGYRAYAEDFLARMTSPWLGDTVARVGRDVERKLGWDDRLVATIRAARQEGVAARRYAFGVAAALATLDRSILEKETPLRERLMRLWQATSPSAEELEAILALVEEGAARLRQWCASGFQNLEDLFRLTT
jgi:mannitol-1-phosphate 5-dehydrogenase